MDSAWEAWKKIFLHHVRQAVPSKLVKCVKPHLPWLNVQLRKLIKEKRAAWRAFKANLSETSRSKFVHLRNKVTSLRSSERTYLQSLHRDIRLTNSTRSTRSFWHHIKRFSGGVKSSTIPDLTVQSSRDAPVTIVSSDREKADALNAFFASQTKLDTGSLSLPNLPALSSSSFCDMQTTPVEVYDVLIRLQPDKASGTDDIQSFCLFALVELL